MVLPSKLIFFFLFCWPLYQRSSNIYRLKLAHHLFTIYVKNPQKPCLCLFTNRNLSLLVYSGTDSIIFSLWFFKNRLVLSAKESRMTSEIDWTFTAELFLCIPSLVYWVKLSSKAREENWIDIKTKWNLFFKYHFKHCLKHILSISISLWLL